MDRMITSKSLFRTCQQVFRRKTYSKVCKYHTEKGVYGYRPHAQQNGTNQEVGHFVENRIKNSNLYRLVSAYREHGHRKAQLDPLKLAQPQESAELNPEIYGLSSHNQETFDLTGIFNMGKSTASIDEILQSLENIYCGPLTVECLHMQCETEREWFTNKFEEIHKEEISNEKKIDLAKLMLQSQAFDNFLANKFTTVKRYSGEGAESMMGFFNECFALAAQSDIQEVVICNAHRGRSNLLTCLLEFPPVIMFQKMKGKSEFPPGVAGIGDVLSHLTSSVDLKYGDKQVHVTMLPNPSHLEAVNPVTVGKVRGKMQTHQEVDYQVTEEVMGRTGDKVMAVQVHGDAAFAGQGIVAETFLFANLPHFDTGGSIHFIINNQIGFTTEASRGRSSSYSSCVAKMNSCPIIHVNADYPENLLKACKLAMAYRQEFRKDVLVDFVCYRRWGHNELDDPSFTQPNMYKVIHNRKSIPDLYAEKITADGLCTEVSLGESVQMWNSVLNENLKQIDTHIPKANHLEGLWKGFVQAPSSITDWESGLSPDLLKFIGAKSVQTDKNLKVHPTLLKSHIDKRVQKLEEGRDLDWATAEALAVGSLLCQGYNVRMSGQDVGRGTFSHRHVMLVDQDTDEMYIPLNHMLPDQQGHLEVANSPLSEEAVLAFEYGMSIENPKSLIIWEAQFGDFFNGAQIIINTFISSGEMKWLTQSSLTMLLPHGMDGAGPEHSSCRIERFLQMCDSKEDGVDGDDVNMHIVNPTTPAQYFHLLRRQVLRNFRKPLIVASPKLILRLPAATSRLSDMAPGTTFSHVLPDPDVNPAQVTKVVFCSGKHYYTLQKERESMGAMDTALIRVECLCPFPVEGIRKQLSKYPNVKEFIWSQEEHRNMGAWSFVSPRFENVVGAKLSYVGRDVLGAPAVGVGEVHQKEVKQIISQTFGKS